MKKIIILLALIFTGNCLLAQNTHFTTSGTVEYEKTINVYAIFKKRITKENESYMMQFFDNFKKTNPQFKKMKSVLTFSKDKALFKPVAEEVTRDNFWGNDATIDQINTVATDLATNTSVLQKRIFEELFLVKDSVRKINWKITDEKRDVAGYSCRRANALIMDSIYVVAFYAEEIPVSVGPESFAGLPGMILGVALPHENLTWFATKVTDLVVEPKALAAPVKGKTVNNKQLKETLDPVMKDWGASAQIMLKAFLL